MNKRKGMRPEIIWFKKGEKNKLSDAVIGNYQDEAFEILIEMYKRGDL